MFPLIDLVFVVTILLSLAALVFSYDAVSGEREDGTLKLALANGVPRSTVLAGKFAGGAIVLFVPFLIALSLGLIYVLLQPRIGWSAVDGGALGLLLAGSAVYTMVFYGLGFLISARHASSASSIMTSLVVWVVLVLVVPNLSPYLAELAQSGAVPDPGSAARSARHRRTSERDELGRKLSAERRGGRHPGPPGACRRLERMSESDIKATIAPRPRVRRGPTPFSRVGEAPGRLEGGQPSSRGEKGQVLRGGGSAARRRPRPGWPSTLSLVSPLAGFTYAGDRSDQHGNVEPAALRRGSSGPGPGTTANTCRKKMAEMRQAGPDRGPCGTPPSTVSDMPRFRLQGGAPGATRLRAALVPFAYPERRWPWSSSPWPTCRSSATTSARTIFPHDHRLLSGLPRRP
jgi:ABC-type transport system involved in multi-copper enzyme maturation permease subunit